MIGYLVCGAVIYASYGYGLTSPLEDIRPSGRVRGRDLLLVALSWAIALVIWPLAVLIRASDTVRHQHTSCTPKTRR